MTDPRRPERALVFTGHRIDPPGRAAPRFPADAEPVARRLIEEAVERETAGAAGRTVGIAAGASGGDILFHEVCARLAVPTRLSLALPLDEFVRLSVADAGPEWVERFERLAACLPTRFLERAEAGAGEEDAPTAFARANLWMLDEAAALAAGRVTLLALWDGEAGGGPGGTADLVERARGRGVRVVVLPAKLLIAEGQRASS